jgi:hypothetical protein
LIVFWLFYHLKIIFIGINKYNRNLNFGRYFRV